MIDTLIEVHRKRVLLLEHAIANGIIPDPSAADVWVVNHDNETLVKAFLRQIIGSNDIRVYLKPIFLQKKLKKFYLNRDYHLKHLCDGYLKDLNIIDKLPVIEQLELYVKKYKDQRNSKNFETNNFLLLKTFDYYYTRKKRIRPVLNHMSLTGYSYPRIEAFFSNERDAFITSRLLLQEAYSNDWLSRKYEDTSHLCSKCTSGFLNYREICPKCGKHDLRASWIIHHFRCAHVGEENDYIFKDKLVCPKCSSTLKNLGVDYDRPGKVYICGSKKCQHEFQDPPVGVNCVDCETEQSPSKLIVQKIYRYKITKLGIEKGLLIR